MQPSDELEPSSDLRVLHSINAKTVYTSNTNSKWSMEERR